ncbi:MAG: hypothetical protein JW969_19400 [Spirochaetales bacterium]|nr:hypothetical protein [Spirochaetales bacterium]
MEAQLINYPRLSRIKVGYLINFRGTYLVFRRFVYTGNSLTSRGTMRREGESPSRGVFVFLPTK